MSAPGEQAECTEPAPTEYERALLDAATAGDVQAVSNALLHAEAAYQDPADGRSALMAAAAGGHAEVVSLLLQRGAPWNACDRNSKCAGEYALKAGHQSVVDQLVSAGTQAELIFAALERNKVAVASLIPSPETGYLGRKVSYETGDLIDNANRGVMMAWEGPLMVEHAKQLCAHAAACRPEGGDVMNIGFGMGLVDTAIQELRPRSHTIIEAHPQVYQKMLTDGWDKKPGVRIVFGRWQEHIDTVGQVDAVFFDTFDDVGHLREFHQHLDKVVRPGGMYSFFNGISDNVFFLGVACEVIRVELESLGFNDTQFEAIDINIPEGDWQHCDFKYFDTNQYYLPTCTRKAAVEAEPWEQLLQNDSGIRYGLQQASYNQVMILNLESENSNDEVILVSHLDQQHGGLSWSRDSTSEAGIVRHLRTKRWMLPMLNDAKRNELYMAAIKAAAQDLPEKAVVLDIGTGSGLLAMQAANCAPASAHVYACEMAAPMARMAQSTIEANKLSDRVTVLADQSNSVTLEQRADLCVSELLDYGLIGEGVIPTMRDAWARLLKPSATVIPSQAKVHVQLVTGGAVQAFGWSAGSAELLHLQLTAEPAPIAVHAQQLFATGTVALTDPTQAVEFDFRSAQAVPSAAGRTGSTRLVASGDGVAAGVLVWWELEIGAGSWYNSNGEWQDHWPQALYALPASGAMQLSVGDEVELITSHDDQLLTFQLQKVSKKSKHEEPAATPLMLSANRVRQLNDTSRLSVLRAGLLDALTTRGMGACCLDISDGPVCALMAAGCGATCVTSIEAGSDDMTQLAIHLCGINGASDPGKFRVAAGQPQHLQQAHVLGGSAEIVLCEPYFERLEGWHVHEALNMFYTARVLREHGLVRPDAVYVPSTARLVARAVQFDTCAAAYRPTPTVCGFEHGEFAEAAKMHQHEVNLPMWQYSHSALTEDMQLLQFGFGDASLSSEVARTEVQFTQAGRCDAVVVWVDYLIDHKTHAGDTQLISTNSDVHQQYVRFLEHPVEVAADGNSTIVVSFGVGPQANKEDYTLTVEVKC